MRRMISGASTVGAEIGDRLSDSIPRVRTRTRVYKFTKSIIYLSYIRFSDTDDKKGGFRGDLIPPPPSPLPFPLFIKKRASGAKDRSLDDSLARRVCARVSCAHARRVVNVVRDRSGADAPRGVVGGCSESVPPSDDSSGFAAFLFC